MRWSIWPKPKDKPREHRDFTALVMIDRYGFQFQWDAFDSCRDQWIYKIAFFWRSWEPRIWWEFRWEEWEANAVLTYSRGSKSKQVGGWTLRGPLVKFIKASV